MVKSVKLPVIVLWIVFIHLFIPPAFSQQPESPQSQSSPSIIEQYYHWIEMGETAIPELKEAIKSDNWRIRTHALLAMGKTKDPALTSLVLDRLNNDPNTAVKNCAVMALGDLQETSAVPILLDLLARNTQPAKGKKHPQQRLIVQSLGKIGDSRAIKPLFNLLILTKNKQIRGEIAEALIAINDPAVSSLILAHQSDPGRLPYIQAAQISGALPIDGTENFLISLVNQKQLPVKNAAVIALGNIRSEKSVPVLLSLFETEDRHLQKNISNALISIDTPSATIPVCELLGSPDRETAMASAIILTRMTDKNIGPQVYDRFESNHQLNAPAAIVLGQRKYEKAIPELRARLKNNQESGQDEMAEALGWLDDRESISLLMGIATRKNKQGSVGAIWSLGHLKADEAIPLMLNILKKQDRKLTAPAVFALGEIGNPSTVKPLINLYYESGFQYQMQIALALAQIGGPEVAEILKTNMGSGNPKRQKMAGYMLLKSRDPSLVPYAITLLNHSNETIRRYALGGLKNISGQDFDTIEQWETWEKQQH